MDVCISIKMRSVYIYILYIYYIYIIYIIYILYILYIYIYVCEVFLYNYFIVAHVNIISFAVRKTSVRCFCAELNRPLPLYFIYSITTVHCIASVG